MRTANTLIRLGERPDLSESSLGAQVILLVLSSGGSFLFILDSLFWPHSRRIEVDILYAEMAMLLQKTSSFTHRAFKYKYLNHLFSSPGLGTKVNYSTAISAQSLLKSGLQSCTCSRKLLQTHTAGHKWQLRHFSKENLILEQDGETLIRSPYKDIYIPPVSFAEYMFSKLDEYKNINCLVSLSFQNHFILFSKYIIVKMVSKLIWPIMP